MDADLCYILLELMELKSILHPFLKYIYTKREVSVCYFYFQFP